MKVLLTFDVEVWCGGWKDLDQRFPASFQRYVYGRSRAGAYALPKTLEIMATHGVKGVFFVEPLFAARFGVEHLAVIVKLLLEAGQDVQMHLHPEWADEISPAILPNHHSKRQFLNQYHLAEQLTLLEHARRLLSEAGAPESTDFRAGSFACNRDTFRALAALGIRTDSSLNHCFEVSGPDLPDASLRCWPALIEGVRSAPVAVFTDGLGRRRPAHLTACSFEELRAAIEDAESMGQGEFVVVSHNFEMLRPDRSTPDRLVVRRFDRLCRYLASNADRLPTGVFSSAMVPAPQRLPAVGAMGTLLRLAEQAWRRTY